MIRHRIDGATVRILTGITLTATLVGWGCSGGNDGSSGSGAPSIAANNMSSELFERSYGYLIKEDPEFVRLAPNYSTLRPFERDTALVIQTASEHGGMAQPDQDFAESFHVRVNRAMAFRFIVADSTGNGLITYEWANLPEGEYTLGDKGWPLPQQTITQDHRWVYVYFVGDRRFRSRYQFLLDPKQHFTHMPESELGSTQNP